MRLSRLWCQHCKEDTLHQGWYCVHCGGIHVGIAVLMPRLSDSDNSRSGHARSVKGGKSAKLNPRRALAKAT